MFTVPGKQGSSQQTENIHAIPDLISSCEFQPQNPLFSSNLATIPSEQEDYISKRRTDNSFFTPHLLSQALKNRFLGQTPWSMIPETAVSEKRNQANMKNNLQDQSIKSEVTVVSATTFVLFRWKHIPVQQDVGANKATGSCS